MRMRNAAIVLVSAAIALPTTVFAQGSQGQGQAGGSQMQNQDQSDQSNPRARMGSESQSQQSQQVSSVRNLVNDMVKSAYSGQLEDFVDAGLAENSADRMKKNNNFGAFKGVSDQFKTEWEKKYGHSFAETASDVKLPLQVQQQNNQTVAQINTSQGNIDLALKKSGWFGASYRVVAPESLTGQQLQTQMQEAAQKLTPAQFSWPKSEKQAYEQVAYQFLKPLSMSSSQGSGGQSGQGSDQNQ
jgi:hypothetical protein